MEALQLVKQQCNTQVFLLVLDLNDAASLQDKVADALKLYGNIDILINNAGVSQRSLATETQFEVYRQIMEVNFFGTIALTKEILKHFQKKNAGTFVTLSSVAGITGLPYRTAYCAAKFALEGFFAALRTELWKTNIHIMMVRPGAVNTNIAKNALTGNGAAFNDNDKIIAAGMPPEKLAEAILKSIVEKRKVLMIGSFKEKLLFVLNRFMPVVVFNAVKKIKH